ncbi:MAG: cell division protein FtsL [Marinobacter sp.]|uniref:cell division protein FtsL n=1 Tax=Marinobacter sp. TaxID=50741 RepID=UPI00299E1D03|nr:cell division protein FtsL [Marinobacter sp.]MDX1635003.1 cell division protein FtsL [Marinobacter sp.]
MSAVTIERPPREAVLNRQKVRRGLSTTLRLSQRIFQSLCQTHVAITLVLALVLIASAIGVVASAHENRRLFNTLSELHGQRDDYQREWSQLLLEQSALSAHSRIEHLAADQLGMSVPGKNQIVLVPGASAGMTVSR